VRDNCEEGIDVSETTSVAPPSHGTTDAKQQRQREFFLETRGG
jgi:hypothetical protein